MTHSKDVNSYPFWRPDYRQNPFSIAARGVKQLVSDVRINQTPLSASRMTNVKMIMTPHVKQDSQRVPAGDRMQTGVGQPGYLYDRLMKGVATQKGTTKT